MTINKYKKETKYFIMNKNVDLTKILKDCPKGWKFWSPIFGEVEFEEIFKLREFVNVKKDNESWSFYSDATFPIGDIKSVEIMLYPSEDQRDWSKFTAPWYKKEKFDPKTFKPFDKVIVRDSIKDKWNCSFFSYICDDDDYFPYITTNFNTGYSLCIPFNDETKHLVGTTDEAPEYYKYWMN